MITRLAGLALCVLAAACGGSVTATSVTALENARGGDATWMPAGAPSTAHALEAYALVTTLTPGATLRIAASAKGGARATVRLFRLGHYAGKGARLVKSIADVDVPEQAACPREESTGLVSCAWHSVLETRVGAEFTPGVYLARFSTQDSSTVVPFVVRDPAKHPAVVLVLPTATWAAYNAWGGESLYKDASGAYGAHAYAVSYDRPFEGDLGAGQLLSRDRGVIEWLESQDLDVGYLTDEDLDRDPRALDGARAVLVSTHDEYWSTGQRDALDAHVARGGSLLLLGANAGYWHVRLSDAADGRDRRVITCYKRDGAAKDPVGAGSPELTVRFRDLGRPENALFGVMYQDGWAYYAPPLVVTHPEHWIFAGTGLKAGDVLRRAAGYEADQVVANGATPAGVKAVAESPFLNYFGDAHVANMAVREQGSAIVFASGGTDFAFGLGDPRVARIVANVLYRALGRSVPEQVPCGPEDHAATEGPARATLPVIAGVSGHAGVEDGPREVGRLATPLALAALPGGGFVTIDSGARALRVLSSEGVLSTLAMPPSVSRAMGVVAGRSGELYLSQLDGGRIWRRDASGTWSVLTGEVFSQPMGLALSADGATLWVGDANNGAVRAVSLRDPAAPVRTLASGLGSPGLVAVAPDGSLVVGDVHQHRLFSVALDGKVKLLAGGTPGLSDGRAPRARLSLQLGLAVLPDGGIVFTDPAAGRVRRLAHGEVETLAFPHGADRLQIPTGLAVGADGRLVVADAGASTLRFVPR